MWPVKLQVLLDRLLLQMNPLVVQEAHQTRVRLAHSTPASYFKCQPA
uniref:Uncharacterized protein n=1 Tax=Aegilops tauschii subsp. strangulata TaxID=200361 RepID=A0A453QVL9_AEGTS